MRRSAPSRMCAISWPRLSASSQSQAPPPAMAHPLRRGVRPAPHHVQNSSNSSVCHAAAHLTALSFSKSCVRQDRASWGGVLQW